VGGLPFEAPAPAATSTATSSSSAPVTTGGFVVRALRSALAPTTASTAANDDNNETNKGLHLGGFEPAPTGSGDSMDDVRVSCKERKKKRRGDDKADDGEGPYAKRVKRS
jgi:hypothetical protein